MSPFLSLQIPYSCASRHLQNLLRPMVTFSPLVGQNRTKPNDFKFRSDSTALYQPLTTNQNRVRRFCGARLSTDQIKLSSLDRLRTPLLFDTSSALVSFGARFFQAIPVKLISFASVTYGQSS